MPETDYYILRVGEIIDGRLCSETREGETVLERSFFRAPRLTPREKYKPPVSHCFLPSSALR